MWLSIILFIALIPFFTFRNMNLALEAVRLNAMFVWIDAPVKNVRHQRGARSGRLYTGHKTRCSDDLIARVKTQ